jgi:hypothetical protein
LRLAVLSVKFHTVGPPPKEDACVNDVEMVSVEFAAILLATLASEK